MLIPIYHLQVRNNHLDYVNKKMITNNINNSVISNIDTSVIQNSSINGKSYKYLQAKIYTKLSCIVLCKQI